MSQFAKQTFDTAKYLSFRPSYSSSFYDLTYRYHAARGGKIGTALDIGCGPGFIAQTLAAKFEHVSAVDPSSKMVEVGLQPPSGNQVDYSVGFAEDLGHIKDGSVDLITAGQAAHWFDFSLVWQELGRVLSDKGTVAFWGYGEMYIPSHPSLSPLITDFMRGPSSLGPYWQQPGRSIVEALLDPIPFPAQPSSSKISDGWPDFPRAAYVDEPPAAGDSDGVWDPESFLRIKTDAQGEPLGIKKRLTWGKLESYLRTASALHKYKEEHPEDEESDIVRRFAARLRTALEEKEGKTVEELDVEWPAVVMLAGKQ